MLLIKSGDSVADDLRLREILEAAGVEIVEEVCDHPDDLISAAKKEVAEEFDETNADLLAEAVEEWGESVLQDGGEISDKKYKELESLVAQAKAVSKKWSLAVMQ